MFALYIVPIWWIFLIFQNPLRSLMDIKTRHIFSIQSTFISIISKSLYIDIYGACKLLDLWLLTSMCDLQIESIHFKIILQWVLWSYELWNWHGILWICPPSVMLIWNWHAFCASSQYAKRLCHVISKYFFISLKDVGQTQTNVYMTIDL